MRTLFLITAMLYASLAGAVCIAPILDKVERRLVGGEENLCESYAGKVVLVVNTASKCGFTPQYEGLEALYKSHKDLGLVVLGFPSDQFGGQEYADNAEIAKFCKLNFGVSFPMFQKSDVKGEKVNPLFRDLIAATGKTPAWNFNKYLVTRDGKTVRYFPSKVAPDAPELMQAIDAALAQPAP
ncbi:MAG: glutathione peroxidase [Sinimarinibacterium sp.]|jgi:glutathione peroxidase